MPDLTQGGFLAERSLAAQPQFCRGQGPACGHELFPINQAISVVMCLRNRFEWGMAPLPVMEDLDGVDHHVLQIDRGVLLHPLRQPARAAPTECFLASPQDLRP
jgi:hypothetical protein